jgi:hypothetical protein
MNHREKHHELLLQRMKLDRFFTMFLDKFERKMDPDNTDTPIWKLYKLKMKEYGKISQDIKNEEYWIKKELHV